MGRYTICLGGNLVVVSIVRVLCKRPLLIVLISTFLEQRKDQAGYGKLVRKEDIQTGDLIFFKTGRGPNGYHVGIYVKEDKFLHASTKGGVIYSSMNSPYWKKAFLAS